LTAGSWAGRSGCGHAVWWRCRRLIPHGSVRPYAVAVKRHPELSPWRHEELPPPLDHDLWSRLMAVGDGTEGGGADRSCVTDRWTDQGRTEGPCIRSRHGVQIGSITGAAICLTTMPRYTFACQESSSSGVACPEAAASGGSGGRHPAQAKGGACSTLRGTPEHLRRDRCGADRSSLRRSA